MSFQRYSAVPWSGVPLGPEVDMNSRADLEIPSEPVPVQRTEITPPYFKEPTARLYISMHTTGRLVVVEVVPEDTELKLPTSTRGVQVGDQRGVVLNYGVDITRIPTDQDHLAVIGPTSGDPDVYRLHELITHTED